jgi:hypothetical protein
MGREFFGDGAELGAVVDIAGVDLVEQRNVEVGADGPDAKTNWRPGL